ncbi:unnamed protein product [Amaranthus hypochondriacus]
MRNIHQQTELNIQKATQKYQQKANKSHTTKRTYQIGDWLWLYLRKERFPSLRKNKLMPRADGPFQILEKYGDNADKLDLPRHYSVSPIFNVGDLQPYYDIAELRRIVPEEGGNEPSPTRPRQPPNEEASDHPPPDSDTDVDSLRAMDVHGLLMRPTQLTLLSFSPAHEIKEAAQLT